MIWTRQGLAYLSHVDGAAPPRPIQEKTALRCTNSVPGGFRLGRWRNYLLYGTSRTIVVSRVESGCYGLHITAAYRVLL